jgi:hypothetical protein
VEAQHKPELILQPAEERSLQEVLGPEEWVFRNYTDIMSATASRRMRLVRFPLTGHTEAAVGHS